MKLIKVNCCADGKIVVNLDKFVYAEDSPAYGKSTRVYLDPLRSDNYIDIAVPFEELMRKLEVLE